MIPAKTLIIEFDRRYDRFVSEYKKNLSTEHKIAALNEAQDKIFENLVSIAETNSEVRDDLRIFEKKDISLDKVDTKNGYSIFEIPKELYKRLRIKSTIKNKECGIKENIPVIWFQTDDLDQSLKDEYWSPSFEWENVIGDEGDKGYYIYTNNKFEVDELIIDYYRRPKSIHCASMHKQGRYIYTDGKEINFDSDCEFSNTFKWHNIIDMAVLYARSDIGDARDFQLQKNKIEIKER